MRQSRARTAFGEISRRSDVPGVREMSEIYPGNLFFGEDLMVIPVGDPHPRKLD